LVGAYEIIVKIFHYDMNNTQQSKKDREELCELFKEKLEQAKCIQRD
jgi:hypothetical protein